MFAMLAPTRHAIATPSPVEEAQQLRSLGRDLAALIPRERKHLLELSDRLAEQLTREGFAVWVPEYRRVGDPGGGWPGTFDDIRMAVAELLELADPRLDLERLALVGHSAGGHLALWLAAQRDNGAFRPEVVVGLAAITDLEAYATGENSCQRVTPQLMGGNPGEMLHRYRLASPAALPVLVPTVLLRGALDGIVGLDQLEAMADSTLLERRSLEDASHFEWIHPQTSAYEMLRDVLREHLNAQTP